MVDNAVAVVGIIAISAKTISFIFLIVALFRNFSTRLCFPNPIAAKHYAFVDYQHRCPRFFVCLVYGRILLFGFDVYHPAHAMFQYFSAVLLIAGMVCPLQITRAIVRLYSVFVVYLKTTTFFLTKCERYEPVDFVLFTAQRDYHIPVLILTGRQ